MKNSELKKLISQYKEVRDRKKKKNADKFRIEELKEIEHRYFHETGLTLKSDFIESA